MNWKQELQDGCILFGYLTVMVTIFGFMYWATGMTGPPAETDQERFERVYQEERMKNAIETWNDTY